jgi:acyl-coenzyme A thioesterase PaaI-like protein
VQPPLLTVEELVRLFSAEFPQMLETGVTIERVSFGGALLRQAFRAGSLRPGETISGATIMALGDYAVYVALLASIGWVPLAVTTSLNVNFLRKPPQRDLLAECRLIKLGRRLAVGEVAMRADGEEALVAQLCATYSIPPRP